MWKAIEAKELEVAQRLFYLGAETAMVMHPNYTDLDSEKRNWHIFDDCDVMSIPHAMTSLMIATKNNDLPMMRWLLDVAGVDVNMQSCTIDFEHGKFGELNALWIVRSREAAKVLLSRGANPKQECIIYTLEEHSHSMAIPLLMYFVKELPNNDRISGMDKLLIRHGANPNCFQPVGKIIDGHYGAPTPARISSQWSWNGDPEPDPGIQGASSTSMV